MAGKGAVWKAVFAVSALGPGRAPADRPQGIVKIDHDDVARRLRQAELFEGEIISEVPQASDLVGNARAVVTRKIRSATCRQTANGVPPPLTGCTRALPSARAGPGGSKSYSPWQPKNGSATCSSARVACSMRRAE